ncbi:MAG: zinc-binding dehydrogenase [Chitinophagales bacterium]|nr:zinc-binding dehydrogenase [Chitinophagales bacterium]
MKAAYLIKNGKPEEAFEIREIDKPIPGHDQVLIKVEGFGLNFADVMARLGHYKDAPPLPAILGYDVVGTIDAKGEGVEEFNVGDRVTALTRFGGYAEFAVSDRRAIAKIPDDMDAGVGVALSTQYCTAYMLSIEMVRLHKNDHVLIHAAAGGVGTALIQIAQHHECIIFGTAGSDKKIQSLKDSGVHHAINYRKEDFAEVIRKIVGKRGLDVVFDPIGGSSVKKGFRLLGAGGRIITFGGSAMTQAKGLLGKIRVGIGFGIYHPVAFLMNSRGMIGVNMLRIADQRPHMIERVMKKVVKMTEEGILKPEVGGEFSIDELADSHRFLESRKSMGKIIVRW